MINLKLPTNRNFGIFFSIIFFLTASYLIYIEFYIASYILFFISIIFFIISLIFPKILLPINKLWMYFGYYLGKIVSPIILGIIFFGLFTPYAIFMKIIKRDELKIKKNKRISYWMKRPSDSSQINFKRQF